MALRVALVLAVAAALVARPEPRRAHDAPPVAVRAKAGPVELIEPIAPELDLEPNTGPPPTPPPEIAPAKDPAHWEW